MSSEIVYAKTQKGFEEMTRRTYRLPARMRTLLIMIDGKQTAGELFSRSQNPEEAEQLIESLLNDGFIEPIGGLGTMGSAPAASVAAGGDGSATPDTGLAAAKRYMTQAMIDALGAEADRFTIQIDAARDASSLKAIALKYLDVIRSVSDAKKADAFRHGLLQLQIIAGTEGAPSARPAASTADLEGAKRIMVRTLVDTLGPDADRFTMTAERAGSVDELRALLTKYQEVVRSIGGKKKADEFVAAVNAALGN